MAATPQLTDDNKAFVSAVATGPKDQELLQDVALSALAVSKSKLMSSSSPELKRAQVALLQTIQCWNHSVGVADQDEKGDFDAERLVDTLDVVLGQDAATVALSNNLQALRLGLHDDPSYGGPVTATRCAKRLRA